MCSSTSSESRPAPRSRCSVVAGGGGVGGVGGVSAVSGDGLFCSLVRGWSGVLPRRPGFPPVDWSATRKAYRCLRLSSLNGQQYSYEAFIRTTRACRKHNLKDRVARIRMKSRPLRSTYPTFQAIKTAYEQNHGMSLMKAVNKGCSGTYKKCLLACLFPSSEVTRHKTLKTVGRRDGSNSALPLSPCASILRGGSMTEMKSISEGGGAKLRVCLLLFF